MKMRLACIAVALTSLVSVPALAGDYGYGSVKDGGYGGVPVPAPIPVPETFSWYVRGDVAITSDQGGGAHERGFQYGLPPPCGTCYTADAPFGMSDIPVSFKRDDDALFTGGIGFGRYITPQFRMDATLDFSTRGTIHGNGTYSYSEYDAPGGAQTGNTVNGDTRERIYVQDTVAMLNAYYDLVPRGRLTPYIGLGAGVAMRTIDRQHSTTEERYDPTNTFIDSRTWSGSNRESRFALAGSATLGLAYAISPGVIVDVNYRYTYLGSVESSMRLTPPNTTTQSSRITVDESHQHAIRAGLRWNLW